MRTSSAMRFDGAAPAHRNALERGDLMRHTIRALLLTIALLTGFTVRSVLVPSSFPTGAADGNAGKATATAFYDSLNRALAGGPIEPLGALLSVLYRNHNPETGESRTAEQFLEDVRAMSAKQQVTRLSMTSMELSGNHLVIGIEPVRSSVVQVVGLTVEPPLSGPHFETLRIEGGKVVDRWAPPIPWIETIEDSDAVLSASSLIQVAAELVRVEISRGAELTWRTANADIVMIESGTVHLSISRGGTTLPPEELGAGELIAFERGSQVRARSVDGDGARALVLATGWVGVADIAHSSLSLAASAQGVPQSVLWSGVLSGLGSRYQCRPGLIVLRPGAKVELSNRNGIHALVGIASGFVEVDAPGGTVTTLSADRSLEDHAGNAQLDSDHAGAITGSTSMTIRNPAEHPIAIMIIAIESGLPVE